MSLDRTIPADGADLLAAPVRRNFEAIDDALTALISGVAARTTAAQAAAAAPIQALVAGANIGLTNEGGTVTITAAGGEGGTADHVSLINRGAADQHPVAAISGLQAALDAKAATLHAHTIAQVDGLQSALDAKTSTAQAAAAAPVQSVAGRVGAVTVAKADVGLGNCDNTADSAKPISSAAQAALDLKAPLASPAFTGDPTAPTQAGGNDSTRLATTAFVQAALAGVGDSHTHGLGGVVGLQDELDLKAPLASPVLTGNPTAPTQATGDNSTRLATTAFSRAAIAAYALIVDTEHNVVDGLKVAVVAAMPSSPHAQTLYFVTG